MFNKLNTLIFAVLLTGICKGQTFSELKIDVAAGYNAYTISSSTLYNEKWMIDVGYQTNEYHFRASEASGDLFADRFFVSLLRPFSESKKITHFAGIGAISTPNRIPISGSLRYQLAYLLTDQLALNSNIFMTYGYPSEINLGLSYRIL